MTSFSYRIDVNDPATQELFSQLGVSVDDLPEGIGQSLKCLFKRALHQSHLVEIEGTQLRDLGIRPQAFRLIAQSPEKGETVSHLEHNTYTLDSEEARKASNLFKTYGTRVHGLFRNIPGCFAVGPDQGRFTDPQAIVLGNMMGKSVEQHQEGVEVENFCNYENLQKTHQLSTEEAAGIFFNEGTMGNEAIRQLGESVLQVKTTHKGKQHGGSAVVISADLVLSAAHVFFDDFKSNDPQFLNTVNLDVNGKLISVTKDNIVAVDFNKDQILIRLPALKNEKIPPAPLPRSKPQEVGALAAIGFTQESFVTYNEKKYTLGNFLMKKGETLVTSVRMDHGNSGGGVFDLESKTLAGIAVSIRYRGPKDHYTVLESQASDLPDFLYGTTPDQWQFLVQAGFDSGLPIEERFAYLKTLNENYQMLAPDKDDRQFAAVEVSTSKG